VTHPSIHLMSAEELFFVTYSIFNRQGDVNLMLRAAFYSKIAQFERVYSTLKVLDGVSAFVHEVNFCNYTDCSITIWIDFAS
jgi:hypothetical protein